MNMLFISKDDSYSYIDSFINYLERLINIIINLFKGIKSDTATTTITTAPATEAAKD